MNKHDIMLTVWLLLMFCLLPFVVLNSKKGKNCELVVVKVDGEIIESFDLKENLITNIDTGYGTNTLCIENGEVCVTESDCYGKDCVKFGKISDVNKHIICLPHHLVVYIQGENCDTDAVSY